MEVKGQFVGVGSAFWESNFGHQPWHQVLLPNEPSHQPLVSFLKQWLSHFWCLWLGIWWFYLHSLLCDELPAYCFQHSLLWVLKSLMIMCFGVNFLEFICLEVCWSWVHTFMLFTVTWLLSSLCPSLPVLSLSIFLCIHWDDLWSYTWLYLHSVLCLSIVMLNISASWNDTNLIVVFNFLCSLEIFASILLRIFASTLHFLLFFPPPVPFSSFFLLESPHCVYWFTWRHPTP